MTEHPTQAPEVSTSRPRMQAWILIGAFFAPLLLAFLLYYSGSWRPAGSTNWGELIHPARPLPPFELPTISGTPIDNAALHGKWNLVYIGAGNCDNRCREALVLMRQTRLALNDDMTRVQRIFLVTTSCCDLTYLREHAGLVIALADNPTGQQLLAAFPEAASMGEPGRIYIVDPLGNLMMSYGPLSPQKGLLEDLKKLLKLSHIG